jgi:hypothetical protein
MQIVQPKKEAELKLRRFLGSAIMLTALVLYSDQGWSASWQQAWSARAFAEHESNPTMAPAYGISIWRSVFEPSYKFKGTDGVNELNAGLDLQIARSSNKMLSPNRDDPSAFVGWRRQTETGALGLSADYDQVGTRITAIDNTGPGLADNTRTSRKISANLSQALSERSNVALDGAYQHVSYQGGNFIDYVTRSGGMKLSYAWDERSTPFLRLSYVDYEPANGSPPSYLANVLLGWNWKISDYLEWTLQGGRTKIKDTQKMGTQGAVTVQYTGQRIGWALNADRQVSPSGFGGFITVDQVQGNWSYALSERSKTGIDFGWQKNYLSPAIATTTAGAWLQQDINSFWGTRMYYLHKFSKQVGISANSNILGVALTYTPADF